MIGVLVETAYQIKAEVYGVRQEENNGFKEEKK